MSDSLLEGLVNLEDFRWWGEGPDNDHSGVHQWYRWSMRPKGGNNFSGADVCVGDNWNGVPFIWSHSTLNPCQFGWHLSIVNSSPGNFDELTENTKDPKNSSAADLDLVGVSGQNCVLNNIDQSIICHESSSQFSSVNLASVEVALQKSFIQPSTHQSRQTITTMFPEFSKYMTFDFRFSNIGDGDYVYLILDGVPIWKMAGDPLTEGQWLSSQAIPISIEPGAQEVMIILFGQGAQNAQFEIKNFDAITIDPSFVDVPANHRDYQALESLLDNEVIVGCSPVNSLFCPDQTLSRATMSLWLMKAIKGQSYEPNSASGTMFDDVPLDYPFANWIEAMANEGLTQGCDNDNFCPGGFVDRAQIAKIIVKAKKGDSYLPALATGNLFDDVSISNFNADWIEDAVNSNLIEGCSAGYFCSDELLHRTDLIRILDSAFE